ncbi:MAG TPA: hypothetical protein V6D07_12375, partial [Trichocoleus sp.]
MLSGNVTQSFSRLPFTRFGGCLVASWLCWATGSETIAWARTAQGSATTAPLPPTTQVQSSFQLRRFFVAPTQLAQRAEGSGNWPVPSFPDTVPEAISPDETGLVDLDPRPQSNLGIGHLRPEDLSFQQSMSRESSALSNANWLRGVALPIYARPGDRQPWAWLINGWLIIGQSQALAVGKDAAFSMLRTYDDLYTFPVMESRPDGWFRFQYTSAGTAWLHVSHLQLGAVELTWETWEEHFLSTGSVAYRKHGLSQALFA